MLRMLFLNGVTFNISTDQVLMLIEFSFLLPLQFSFKKDTCLSTFLPSSKQTQKLKQTNKYEQDGCISEKSPPLNFSL